MFVILKIIRTDKRRIKKGRTINSVRIVNTGKGQCFYEIEVLSGEEGIAWSEVVNLIGRHSRNVLVPEGYIPPADAPVKRFCSNEFRNILLFNTINHVFRELFYLGGRAVCVVNDPDGAYAQYLCRIVKYIPRITVVTENEFRYFPHIRNIYSDYGAGITLCDSVEKTDRNSVILDTTGTVSSCGRTVFSPVNGFSPGRPDGFDEILGFCPDYINQTDFLAAVYRFNRMTELDGALCRTFLSAGRSFTLFETARHILNLSENADVNKSIIFYV